MTEDWKHTYKEYKTLLKMPLEDKILRSEQIILRELKFSKRPAVACSWGKGSVTMLHLVRKFCKNAYIVFHNTGVEYPETYAYRDRILKEWKIKNYHETKPIMTFWECVDKYGYPEIRKAKTRTPKCCWYLKELPAKHFIKKHGIDSNFVGLQAPESMMRRLSFLREGERFDSKTYKVRMVRPIMIWTDEDIWNYHRQENIPYNPLYDKMSRNGCMPCTGFKGWQEVLAKSNPAMYKHISTEMGQHLIDDDCWRQY